MARTLLWFFVFGGMFVHALNMFDLKPTDLYTKIAVLSMVSVIAICETIEKTWGKK